MKNSNKNLGKGRKVEKKKNQRLKGHRGKS